MKSNKLISSNQDDTYRCVIYIENVAEQFTNRAEFIMSVCELLKRRERLTGEQTKEKE